MTLSRSVRGAATALYLVAVGCSSHVSTTRSRSLAPPHDGPLARAYLYGSARNEFIAVPPRSDQHPEISAATAWLEVQHPQAWPTGTHPHLVVFGYGQVKAHAVDAQGDAHAFRHRRPAWVAIFRFSTMAIAVPKCPAFTAAHKGFHVVQSRWPATITLAAVVDAMTGYQATWSNLPNTCPHLVPDTPPADGKVVGHFLAVGGPPGAPTDKQRGHVYLRGDGHSTAVKVGPNGRFTITAPAGRYRLYGRTPQFTVNGDEATCNALHAVHLRRHRTTHRNVYCQRV